MTTLLPAVLLLVAAAVCRAEEAAGAHHAVGFRENLPFWGLVAFFGFLAALKFLGWDALVGGMQAREEREKSLISEAEQLRQRTAEQLRHNRGLMESLDETVREIIDEAHRDADHTRGDIRAVADREAALSRQRAELEIDRAQAQSLSQIFETAADRIAERAAERIRGGLSPERQSALIDAAVGEFAALK